MHPLFHITPEQIGRLDDEQARELIARLCRAQVQKAGLSSSCVSWGGNQRAPDGGVDVRVEFTPPQNVGGPLMRSLAVVQVKAEVFGPAKIGPEMVPKGVLRPEIAALAQNQGVYLIASTRDDPADPGKRKRVAAMRKVLHDHGLEGGLGVDFIGARQVADWVEQFPTLTVWLRQKIGSPLQGWKGYGTWAYKEADPNAEFLVGNQARVFAPDSTEGMGDLEAIEVIRADLIAGRSVRLVGLSGVGKTRLAQALFDERIETNTPALSVDLVIYTDISDRPEPQPEAMIDALAKDAEQTILVVDNCGQATHSALVGRKEKVANKLGLLTIEYDVHDDLPDETRCYRLEGTSSETLRKLLTERYPGLSSNDLDVVVDASEGNARLAFALASTSEQTGDLSSLKDRELFRRLFEQKAGSNDELLRCAKAASLIYSFDGTDLSESSELSILCKFSGTTEEAFLRNMTELRRRGLLQSRGKMRALLPHAVSNRLAADAIEEAASSLLERRLIGDAPPRVRASFAHRLSYLHGSCEAQNLVGTWLALGGRFGNLESLSSDDFKIFRNLAVLQPGKALATISRFVQSCFPGQRTGLEVEEITRLIHAIAYEPEHFDLCVSTLLALVPLQTVGRNAEKSSLNHLKALFQTYLSGTHAEPEQRAKVVQRLMESKSPEDQNYGIELLGEALKVQDYHHSAPFRFGAQKRDNGWWPRTINDLRNWDLHFLDIAELYATNQGEIGEKVRSILGRGVYRLILNEDLGQRLSLLAPSLIRFDGWLDAWESVRRLLMHKELNTDVRNRAAAFAQIVAPNSVRARVLAAITIRNYVAPEDEDEDDPIRSYERSQQTAERIGEELGNDHQLLESLLPRLLSTSARENIFQIGRGVAKQRTDISTVVSQVRNAISAIPDPKNVNLVFVRGLISSWKDSNPQATSAALDDAISDRILGPWFPELQVMAPIDHCGVERLQESLRLGLAPTWQYRYLAMGNVLKHVRVDSLRPLLGSLAVKGEDGGAVAIEILHMVIHGAEERSAYEKKEFGRLSRDLLTQIDWVTPTRDHRADYGIEQIIISATAASDSFSEMCDVLDRIITAKTKHPNFSVGTTGKFLSPIIRLYPMEALTDLSMRVDSDGTRISDLILQESLANNVGVASSVISDTTLIDWCKGSLEGRVLFAVQICRLSEPTEGMPSLINTLFDLALDKVAFIKALSVRCMNNRFSESETSCMNLGLRILKALPVTESKVSESLRLAIDSVTQRIEWWRQVMEGSSRERAEAFE